ncbi:MAG: hypothetical protein ABI835_00140 [Chloroflexota bacterium]
MQSRQSVHIMSAEWRWVILVGSALVLLAFSPLLWVALRGTPDWQFMGTLHNFWDGASYLSKMRLGYEGSWLVYFQHTPEQHNGAFIQVIYLLLGHLSRLTAVPLIVMFHVARVGASLFMYVSLYQLGATIWTRVRARRTFFVVAVVGSGLGWLFTRPMDSTAFPDLAIPEAFPLYSTFMNVHFPLTIACLALLMGLFITAYRPGSEDDPSVNSSLPLVSLLSVALALLYPQALVPLVGALVLYVGIVWWQDKRTPIRLLRWLLALTLPVIPLAAYYAITVIYNPAMKLWNEQNVTSAPTVPELLIGFGIPLLIALPGIYRAVRRFERDGDRLMLLWLVCIVIALYLPLNVQRRFMVGMIIPIAYFATRAVEDVWLPRISRRLRPIVICVFIPLISVSQILMLFLPVLYAIAGNPSAAVGIFLERDYVGAYQWLETRTQSNDVILASPLASTWIPGWVGARVVYGHPYETFNAAEKERQVIAWYDGTVSDADCAELLNEYGVRYVLYGPEEEKLGQATCLANLRLMAQSGSVAVYAP